MKKLAIGAAVTASILGGSVAVAALTPIGAALAGSRSQPAVLTAGQDPSTPSTNSQGKGQGKGAGRLDQALSDLVKDGTLTQEQADKVRQKLESTLGRGGPRGPRGGFGLLQGGLDEVAKSIGIPTDQLKTELQGGKSIADVARGHNVDPQKVINDLVAAATTRIDDAVKNNKLPQAAADKLKSHLTDAITKLVNGQFKGHLPFGPGGRKGPGGQPGTAAPNGSGNPGAPSPGVAPATPGSSTPNPPAGQAPDTTPAAPGTSSPDTSAPAPSGTLSGG
jgi:hypothetical protein